MDSTRQQWSQENSESAKKVETMLSSVVKSFLNYSHTQVGSGCQDHEGIKTPCQCVFSVNTWTFIKTTQIQN